MPDQLTLRLATAADAAAVLELRVESEVAERGETESTLAEVAADLARPTHREWVHEDADGRVDATVWIEKQAVDSSIFGEVTRDPARGAGLIEPLLEFAKRQARDTYPALPLHVFCDATATSRRDAFEAAGGVQVRVFFRMVMNIASGMPGVELPDGATIRVIRADDPSDLRAMYDVIETAFREHFGAAPATYDEWIGAMSSPDVSDRSLWWLAEVEGEPAAGLIGRLLPRRGWVDEVGTLPAYRGRGLARALLLTAFEEFRSRGFEQVGLGVDTANHTGALGLYESIGMTPTNHWVGYRFEP
ncbi:MAG TPA: GNAT family N-acetyltransferase [Mycobacteriales bacterium]|jgi:ribosomal protein S18 acetylase RimI-like enzyme|nr:GNAT family N-acetyltransferase [Mycobacteriales bacterium]